MTNFMDNWQLIDTNKGTGKYNMEFDLKLLASAEKGEIPPTLRFYRWNPPAVSFGSGQKPEEEANFDFCRQNGIDIVRRPSGGGAILHEDEITYSFTGQISDHPAFQDLLSSYYIIVEGLMAGLKKIGVNAEVRGGKSSGPERFIPCFALSSRHDLVVNDKKIIGSAQRRKKNAFMQHGSIPISYNPQLVTGVFPNPQDFFDKATSIAEVLGYKPEDSVIKEALAQGMEESLGVKFNLQQRL
ncbi:MAG: lipoate--protein ligase family protein [Candidatus Omnitrophica bacterium]|nr:lipoate--protein ligase family protein [Candidatus Omnitrophota bacterium]